MLRYLLYRIGIFIARILPLTIAFKFAQVLSDLQYFFSSKDRKSVSNNLKYITKKENVTFEVREVFRNFGRYLIEFFRMENDVNLCFLKKNVTIHQEYFLKSVLEKGNGGILITAHIGNWELGGVVLSLLDYPITIVALAHKQKKVNDFFNSQRENKGVKVVSTRLAIRRCTAALKKNEFIALAAERDFGAKGEWIDFLGRKVLIPNGPALFAIKSGAPVIPTSLIRRENNCFDLYIGEPVYPDTSLANEPEVQKINLMERYMKPLENKIRKYPSQWLMFREFGVE